MHNERSELHYLSRCPYTACFINGIILCTIVVSGMRFFVFKLADVYCDETFIIIFVLFRKNNLISASKINMQDAYIFHPVHRPEKPTSEQKQTSSHFIRAVAVNREFTIPLRTLTPATPPRRRWGRRGGVGRSPPVHPRAPAPALASPPMHSWTPTPG